MKQQKHIAFLLHFYQPYWQDKNVLGQINAECYRPLFENFLADSRLRLTLNINYSLLWLLREYGSRKTIDLASGVVASAGFELTGTAAYHPILPLIPAAERRRQIFLNNRGVANVLGVTPGPGFFPPEMAFSPEIVPDIAREHGWAVIDDAVFSHPGFYGHAPCKFIPSIGGFPVIMRSGFWSNRLAFNPGRESAKSFVENMRQGLERWFNEQERTEGGSADSRGNGYLVIALDAETFGHHLQNYHQYLFEILFAIREKPDMRLATISELVARFPKFPADIPPGSWSTGNHHVGEGAWYPLWNHPRNRCHRLLWLIIKKVWLALDEKDAECRRLADKIINSCQFWHLSSEHWNPGLALKTMPGILAYFYHCFGGLTLELRSHLEELEHLTGVKIL